MVYWPSRSLGFWIKQSKEILQTAAPSSLVAAPVAVCSISLKLGVGLSSLAMSNRILCGCLVLSEILRELWWERCLFLAAGGLEVSFQKECWMFSGSAVWVEKPMVAPISVGVYVEGSALRKQAKPPMCLPPMAPRPAWPFEIIGMIEMSVGISEASRGAKGHCQTHGFRLL